MDRLEQLTDINDLYVEVPAKNIIIEFFCQTLAVTNHAAQVGMMFAMFITAFPFIWRTVWGQPVWANEDQKILELVFIMPKMIYNMMSVMLLQLVMLVVHKKMHLKQMWLKLIDETALFHSSVEHIHHLIPSAPVLSDPKSFENLIVLLYVIKKFDAKFWLRGEVFGTVLFFCFAAQLGYVAL